MVNKHSTQIHISKPYRQHHHPSHQSSVTYGRNAPPHSPNCAAPFPKRRRIVYIPFIDIRIHASCLVVLVGDVIVVCYAVVSRVHIKSKLLCFLHQENILYYAKRINRRVAENISETTSAFVRLGSPTNVKSRSSSNGK